MKNAIPKRLSVFILCLLVFSAALLMCACKENENSGHLKTDETVYEEVTVNYFSGEGGKIEGNATQRIKKGGDTQTVKAVALYGYVFAKWSDGLTSPERQDLAVTAARSETAYFEKVIFDLCYGVTGNGKIQGFSAQKVLKNDNGTTVTAVADENYRFSIWSDGVTSAERQDLNVTADLYVTAMFERSLFTVNYTAGQGGTLDGETNQNIVIGDSASKVTAVPDENYEFYCWSDGVKTAERIDRNVTCDITVTALFTRKNVVVNYVAETGGQIEGECEQVVKYGDTVSKVRAVATYGYRFLGWSDGVKETERQDIATKDITATAKFERITFKAEYTANGGGKISGNGCQIIGQGDNAETVTAVADGGYEFTGWSDGVKEAERTDLNVLSDITVSAWFKKVYYTVRYSFRDKSGYETGIVTHHKVEYGSVVKSPNYPEVISTDSKKYYFCGWSDGVKTLTRTDEITDNFEVFACYGVKVTYAVFDDIGGRIDGKTEQIFYFEEDCTDVTAVAIDGYVFGGWSDLSIKETRDSDGIVTSDRTYVAYFEPFEKSFNLNYGDLYSAPQKTTITLNRKEVANTFLPVLKVDDYDFCGWYIDENFSLKFADADGKIMLGYYTFLLETDSLYAKFKAKNDDTVTYKTLLVMTDEIHALLSPYSDSALIAVDYKMTTVERLILGLVPIKFSSLLNEWFDGKILFEVDAYFTLTSIGTEQSRAGEEAFYRATNRNDRVSYTLKLIDKAETKSFDLKYHSILNTFGMNDYDYKLHTTTGLAGFRYGSIYIEGIFGGWRTNFQILNSAYNDMLQDSDNDFNRVLIDTYVHEFTHTIEMYYSYGEIYDYHKAVGSGGTKDVQKITKQYLLCQFEYNGEYVGIPESFWYHDTAVSVSYTVVTYGVSNDVYGGYLIIPGKGGPTFYINEKIPYGQGYGIQAVAYSGFKFLGWSDGVTSEYRVEWRLNSSITISAIFEKI